MAFKKVEKNVINYQPPSNDSLRLVSGNTALVTVISQTVPLSGVTNIGLGPGYFYSSTVNRIAEFRGISGDTNITINYVESGDTVGVNLNDNIIVNSISATTIYSGTTNLWDIINQFSGGSFTQQYVSGSTGSQSLISIAPAGVNNVAGDNSVVLSNSSSGFSTNSGILAGKNNTINTGADYSLASGLNNIISAPYSGPTFSRIEGKDNIINNTYTNVSGTLNSGLTSHTLIRGKQNYAIGNYFGIFQLLYNCYGLNQINGAANRTVNAGVNNIHNGFSNHIFNGNYNSILNGTENRLYNSSLALVNGSSNKSYSVNYSTIIGTNNITTTANTASAQFNSIIGATQSRIEDSDKSSILGGQLNRITGVTPGFNVIVNGDGGKIHGSRSTVINGFNSFILDSSDNCTVIGGGDNVINHGKDSIIFNGRLNTVNASTGVTLINVSNLTTSSSDENVLITNKIRAISLTGGTTQMVVADTAGNLSVQAISSGGTGSSSSINNGLNTYTAGTSTFQSVNVSGLSIDNLTVSATTSLNTLSATTVQVRNLSGATTRMVVANTTGALSTQAIPAVYTQYWTVGGQPSALVQNNGYCTANAIFSIVAGKTNTVGASSPYGTILGGFLNQNNSSSEHSTIINGMYNNIKSYSNHGLIGTGRNGYINYSTDSSILNGNTNRIYNGTNYESNYNTILGGYNNKMNRTAHSIVLGGYASRIGIGNALIKYSLVFGKANVVESNYSAIIGGQSYTLTEDNTVMVPKLIIRNLPNTSSTYLLNANSAGNVYKINLSGGTGIRINNTAGLLTVTYTGSTSSGGGATVNNGLNTYTAGTSTFQSVNVSALTIDNLTVSASTSLGSLSATSVQISNLVTTASTKQMVVSDANGNLSANTIPFNIHNYKQSTLPSNSAKRYYRNTPILGSIANGTLAANSIVLSPWYCGKDCLIDEMLINVTTTGGTGIFGIAVYNNFSEGGLFPGTLKQSFGTGKTSPTGIKALTASTAVNYSIGMYWIAIWNSTSFAVNVTSANAIDIGTTSANFTNAFTFTSAATYSNSFPANMSGVTATNTIVPIFNIHMKTIY